MDGWMDGMKNRIKRDRNSISLRSVFGIGVSLCPRKVMTNESIDQRKSMRARK
jgi:hypothetical protein